MQITPRYDGPPVITFEGGSTDEAGRAVGTALVRQRRRLGDLLRSLEDDQWAAPSRCEGWTVQDVVTHLVSTDGFWLLSAQLGIAGEPTRFLAGFDPKASPATMVSSKAGTPVAETLEAYLAASEALCAAVEGFGPTEWAAVAEAPPGHIALPAVMAHALWDSWVHERDIALPLGVVPAEEPDELVQCAAYVAALAPAFAVEADPSRTGSLGVRLRDPEAVFGVRVTGGSVVVGPGDAGPEAVLVEGLAVEIVEMLSVRTALELAVPPDQQWLVGGLRTVFETAP